jgi:hypothetical protein
MRGSRINIGRFAHFAWLTETFSAILVAVPVDPKTLPSDPATLRKIVVDLTAQLDTQQGRLRKVERLLEQLPEARNAANSFRAISWLCSPPKLIRDGASADSQPEGPLTTFRKLLGDERQYYQKALRIHYMHGPSRCSR